MGKILPKRKYFKSSIYSPKLVLGSHIDNVKHTLDYLIFSNEKETEKVLLKKRIKVVIFVTIISMIISSFFSPKGKAEVVTFYPVSCLGGWNNPRNAEGEPQTKSNADETQFNKDNSAVLASQTQADIYCGNFIGQIEENTKPTKIIVSLAWSKGEVTISSESASSSESLESSTSTTDVVPVLASSTDINSSTNTQTIDVSNIATTTDNQKDDTSVVHQIFNSLETLFENNSSSDNTVVPVNSPTQETATSTPPVSFLNSLLKKVASRYIDTVFAQEGEIVASPHAIDITPGVTTTPQIIVLDDGEGTTTNITISSSTEEEATSSLLLEETPINTTSSTNIEDDAPNNFLEILYTFDGTIWKSLGKVNEASMKYRTFEIPISATTSWNDIAGLQIKVQQIQRIDATPTVYLDGIKMEVLYETPVVHPHPDFVRDTLLREKIDDGVRVINIINSDTNNSEIWYTTVDAQGNYGVAPGSWVQVLSDKTSSPYKIIDIYGQNLFLLDESQKMLWVKNLQKETNDGIGLLDKGTTTVQFTKSNGEEWIFEYYYPTKNVLIKIKN